MPFKLNPFTGKLDFYEETLPAGSDGEIQFNNSGVFDSSSALSWDASNKRLGIGLASPSCTLDVAGHGIGEANSASFLFTSYSSDGTASGAPYFIIGKSHNNTIGTLTTTVINEQIVYIMFYGVDTNNAIMAICQHVVEQVGAAGAGHWSTDGRYSIQLGTPFVSAFVLTKSQAWFPGNVSALSFTDRTPWFKANATEALLKVKENGDGKIDHSSLDEFMLLETTENGNVVKERSIGAVVTVLIKAFQEMHSRQMSLEARIK